MCACVCVCVCCMYTDSRNLSKIKVSASNFGCSFRRETKFSVPNIIKIDAQESGQALGF